MELTSKQRAQLRGKARALLPDEAAEPARVVRLA